MRGSTLAVGFFDGVHLGHRRILEQSERALTFSAHPLSVLCPARAPRLIMSLEERLAAIRACGVKDVLALDFTPELAAMMPETFARRYLGETPQTVRCGDNWRFGSGGRGDAAFLRSLGYTVEVAPYVMYEGAPVSSTRIRQTLEAGDIRAANAMLGRPFRIHGTRFAGKGEGRSLGYPTINLRPSEDAVNLPKGVYLLTIGAARAIANYGQAPTFGERAWEKSVWEIHLLEAPVGSLEAIASAEVHAFLRPERTFSSIFDLQAQIARDIAHAQKIFEDLT